MMIWSEDSTAVVTVTESNMAALLGNLERQMQSGQGFSVATLNLDHVVKLSRDTAFHQAYAAHTHVTADGRPIVWLSRLAGQRVSLVPGSELIDPVSALAAEQGCSVALVGSTQAALATAAAELRRRHPSLDIALCYAPAMGLDPVGSAADEAIAALAASRARICFLALGAPKQEIFATYARTKLPQVGFVSIGAGLDFIAGTQRRAPVWVRRMAAEWLWRLLNDPGRLTGRYAACLAALPGLASKAVRMRQKVENHS